MQADATGPPLTAGQGTRAAHHRRDRAALHVVRQLVHSGEQAPKRTLRTRNSRTTSCRADAAALHRIRADALEPVRRCISRRYSRTGQSSETLQYRARRHARSRRTWARWRACRAR